MFVRVNPCTLIYADKHGFFVPHWTLNIYIAVRERYSIAHSRQSIHARLSSI